MSTVFHDLENAHIARRMKEEDFKIEFRNPYQYILVKLLIYSREKCTNVLLIR